MSWLWQPVEAAASDAGAGDQSVTHSAAHPLTIAVTAPTRIDQAVSPAVLPLTLAAIAPQIDQRVDPGLISLASTATAPTRIDQSIHPDLFVNSIVLDAPRIDQRVDPALIALSLALSAPEVGAQSVTHADPITLAIAATAPRVDQRVDPGLTALTMAFNTHSIVSGNDIGPELIALASTAIAPQIDQSIEVLRAGSIHNAIALGLRLDMVAYGSTTPGGSAHTWESADQKYVSAITPSTALTLGAGAVVKARVWRAPTAADANVRAVVYADSAGDPGALLGSSDEVTISNTSPLWIPFVFSTPLNLSAGVTYWIGVHGASGSQTSTNHVRIGTSTSSSTATKLNTDTYADGASDPFGSPSSSIGPLDVYVAAAGGFSVDQAISPALLPHTLTVTSPTRLDQSVPMSLLALTLDAIAPTVQVGQVVNPGLLSFALALSAPGIFAPPVSPGVLSLASTAIAPQVNIAASLGVNALTLALNAPGFDRELPIGLNARTLTLNAPAITVLVSPGVNARTLTLIAPIVYRIQSWRRAKSVQYHALVYAPDGNGGPGAVKLELDPHVLNLVWSQTQNLSGQAAFALARRNPVVDQISWMVDHVKVFRETSSSTRVVFAGKLIQPVFSAIDVFAYALDYVGFLQLSITGYRTAYASKKIGTEVIKPEWDLAQSLTNSPFAFVADGTFEDPLGLDGVTPIQTNADFGVVLFDRLFTFNTLAEMSMANTANNVKFEITRESPHTFNLWKNYGSNKTTFAAVMPGNVASYDFDGGKDGQRFDLLTVISDGAGGQMVHSVQASDANTTLLRRLQAAVAIRTLFGATGGTTETDQGKAALARQLKVSQRYPRLVRITPRQGDFPVFDGNDLGDRFRVILEKADPPGDFYDGYLLLQQIIGAWDPDNGELIDLYLRGQS